MAKITNEIKVYGFHASLALFKRRPQDIIRVYVEPRRVKEVSPLLKWCAEAKKAYHIVPPEEMEKITESIHHEGICMLTKTAAALTFEEFLKEPIARRCCLIYLDGVQNPHNIGSIMRVSAHFGAIYILGEKALSLSSSMIRTAQGGAEAVRLVQLENPQKALLTLKKKGFLLATTSSHGGKSLYAIPLPDRLILTVGEESHGVSKIVQSLSDLTIVIPGTGAVESLNVSAATALLLGEFWRQGVK